MNDDDDDTVTPTDSTWSLPDDYGFFRSINDSRDNTVLSEFGWNLINPPQLELDRIDSGTRCDVEQNSHPTTSRLVSDSDRVKAQSRSVENSVGDDDVFIRSNPLASSSSSDDRPESVSAASGDNVSTGKPPLSDSGGKVKKKGVKRIRQQRFAFVTKTDMDHLEDGYRWRKYGQKAVKNSPYPRSYYRCTNNKCTVKKRVERSSTDPTTVITTYEGQHCHHTVGFPRGLTNHEGAYTRFLAPSSTSREFINYPRPQLPLVANRRASQSQPQVAVSSEPRDHLSHDQPQSSFQDSRVDQGLLGDIVPPIMRN